MDITVYCLNSFTHNNSGGNPAGVVLNADNLTSDQMQYIATQVGYSETAFVSADVQCDFNVRFFTPNNEVNFCGHATLATFSLLFEKQIIEAQEYTQQTKAGKLKVKVSQDGLVSMEQTLPHYLGVVESKEVAELLNIPAALFTSTSLPCEVISTGLADVMIPMPLGYLDSIVPNLDKISRFSEKYNAIGIHLFELLPATKNTAANITASCRNFAPLFGIPEESATGSACGALACYLDKHTVINTEHYTFEQGKTMQSPAMLNASIYKIDGEIIKVEVSGFAHLFDKREVKCTI
jgi:PhzF family phenazine biosynthesis protein